MAGEAGFVLFAGSGLRYASRAAGAVLRVGGRTNLAVAHVLCGRATYGPRTGGGLQRLSESGSSVR